MTDEEQRKIFAKNLNYYIAHNGKLQNEVANDIGEKPTTLNMWCKGKSFPSLGKIQKLADYFGIGKSDLTEDKNNVDSDSEYASVSLKIGMQDERFQKIVIDYYNLPADDKKLFCDFFERFIMNAGRD